MSPPVIPMESTPIQIKDVSFLVQCATCHKIFTANNFREHVCPEEEQPPTKESPASPPHPLVDHPCLTLLEENHQRIRKFIREELKVNLCLTPAAATPPPPAANQSGTECQICLRKLSSKAALAKHLAKHDAEPKEVAARTGPTEPLLDYDICFVCLICGRAFANVGQCEEHLWHSGAHGEKATREAEKATPAEESPPPLMKMDAIVLKFVLQCEFCDFVFARKEDLLKHEATHDPKLGYLCTACEINSTCTKDIQQHWLVHCPFAKSQKSRPAEFAKIRLHNDFLCNVCFESYPSMDILYDHRHKENHFFPRYSHLAGQLLLGCEVCGDIFDNCPKYCDHFEEQHTKKAKTAAFAQNRQYLCHVCGKTYTQSSHLWQHLRFHQGVKPFKCTVAGCERRFTIRPDLNDHVRKFHTHERPYQCLVCGKRFLTGSVFYQHRLIHRGERRYECETCQKRFFRADALKNHNRIHSGEKPFLCQVCGKGFRQRGDCQKHTEARHMQR